MKKVVETLTVNFIRKNVKYKKNLYIIMTSEMESYIVDEDNTQFFCDVTYYSIPPNQTN